MRSTASSVSPSNIKEPLGARSAKKSAALTEINKLSRLPLSAVDMPSQHGTFKQAQRYKSTDGKSQRELM